MSSNSLAAEENFSGSDISQDVKIKLQLASQNWENTVLSEQYINEALALAPNNLDVLIGAYRFFFYKGKTDIALGISEKVLEIVQQRKNLPQAWEQLQSILLTQKDDSLIRLYLNAYAAKGFLLAKIGRIEEAKMITTRVKAIDENRESCASTVFDVLTHSPDEDD
ncbi:hypothetical protein [Gloeothece verrucosa]|uniref:TPR repeat-containing protein n=1 Tax=Gloeothece verrucosa (strain PCC 7822) TaxID=497965 RepID=E0UH30_GLOV7|nr:hypothetical protein [Gloeothece verrucosa]ADN15629.1 conserved hypothetical protein [Gloeothece verrucosa PCC 7822]